MATVHMTIHPNFTHRVVEITREHLWDGQPEKIKPFMTESFGISSDKIIYEILKGNYVMVFQEDGGGHISPREDLTKDELDAMGGAPEVMGVPEVLNMIKLKTKPIVKRQEYILKNHLILFDLYVKHDVDFDSSVLSDEFEAFVKNTDVLPYITAEMATGDIIELYKNMEYNPEAKKIIESIRRKSDSMASRNRGACYIIWLMDEICQVYQLQQKLNTTLVYLKDVFGKELDFNRLDNYNMDGTMATFEELCSGSSKYFWYTPYLSYIPEIDMVYKYIHGNTEQQKVTSALVMQNCDVVKNAVKNYGVERSNRGSINSELDKYLECETRKRKQFGPVKPGDEDWDAGWISPEGHFFADIGSSANFLHLGLAEDIIKWLNLDEVKNPDRYLEKLGWLKFHHTEIAFIGYRQALLGEPRHPITKRQVDRLIEYAACKNYRAMNPILGKSIPIKDMPDMTDEEWENVFS